MSSYETKTAVIGEEERKNEEKAFHDALRSNDAFGQRWSPSLEKIIQENPLWTNMKYYAIERKSRDFVLNWLYQECPQKTVLDYCCGNGEDSLLIAQHGARKVVGIDISGVSIENCTRRAAAENVSHIATFQEMDAEKMTFADSTFDMATEYGCLHHVDLNKAYAELARVLKPGGKVICNEALGHNLVIHWYRKLTPKLRTRFEADHILKKKQLELAKRYFGKVECHFFHFFTLAAVPFRNTRWFSPLLSALEFLDSLFLKLPVVQWQAWQVIFILSEPRKKTA